MADESGGLPCPLGAEMSPGWYPVGENANEKAYWDGQAWTARRSWKGAGWTEFPLDPASGWDPDAAAGGGPATEAAQTGPGVASMVGVQVRAPRVGPVMPTGSVWAVALFVCGVGMILGSVNAWFTVDLPAGLVAPALVSRSISGTVDGGQGWISLIAGIVLIVVSLATAVSAGAVTRLLALMAATTAGASLGVSIYAVDRVASTARTGVGGGLILVLVASIATFFAAGYVTVTSEG